MTFGIVAQQIVGRERRERLDCGMRISDCGFKIAPPRQLRRWADLILMTFILVPNNGEDVQINAWNWRPTVEFLRVQNIITSEHAELLGVGCGVRVDADLADRIATALEDKLSTMKPGDRIRADLSVTDIPKVPQVFGPDTQQGDIDGINLYSATYEWLVKFKDFCKRCDGFEVS